MLARESLPNSIAFLHADLFIPTTQTLYSAIDKGFLTTFPVLAYIAVIKHLPKSIATPKGHFEQQRQVIQSTQTPASPPESLTDTFPAIPNRRRQTIYSGCAPVTGLVRSYQTGKFVAASNRGMSYLLIVYHEYCNSIFADPMRNRGGLEHKQAYQKMHDDLTKRCFNSQL